ncbi:hypothetical protein FHG89_28600 [Micromonospora orduensis]|uniref:Fe2OG dioxygenase domain-containing protein n=1 Tax=Micromonospora orduensis TaxID=1420891 RepID=A0A5C4QA48_9ACTN|nr:hypothetical protein [Micromonospora orduensis]TNH22706.1 hypothetical protein FHG89_28600 [Micromonospora orduensis]
MISVHEESPDQERVRPVTGWSGDEEYFTFREFDDFRPEEVVDVLNGRVAGVIFRGMISPDVCEQIASRFWASPSIRERPSPPGHYLGTYHYHKPTGQYLDECAESAAAVAEVLDVPGRPLDRFRRGLSDALAPQGAIFRLAEKDGRQACMALLRSWHGHGEFALVPHEDRSQCSEPQQADFEIQQVLGYQPAALNICLENGTGGRLFYYNIRPDDESKRRLGLHYTGSPYPRGAVDGFELLRVDVNPGDVYVFNGAHVHAVEPNVDPEARRTTLAALLGFIDDKTVVSWT